MMRTRRYISSRHVQKSSVGWPRNSARPAIARWNACEWTLHMPGTTGPLACTAPAGALEAASTRVKTPPSSHWRTTSRAQPVASSASAAKSAGISPMIPAMPGLFVAHGRIATLRGGRYSIVEDAGLLARDGTIAWIGPMDAAARAPHAAADAVLDAQGALVTPGLIDCHTHLVYAGDRAREFEMRLGGATYEEIARQGGGIAATVRATRAATNAQLRAAAARRLQAAIAEGVTTIEIKSGYGLDVENELRILRVAQSLAAEGAVSVVTTLLGAHAIPAEYAGRGDDYVRL